MTISAYDPRRATSLTELPTIDPIYDLIGCAYQHWIATTAPARHGFFDWVREEGGLEIRDYHRGEFKIIDEERFMMARLRWA